MHAYITSVNARLLSERYDGEEVDQGQKESEIVTSRKSDKIAKIDTDRGDAQINALLNAKLRVSKPSSFQLDIFHPLPTALYQLTFRYSTKTTLFFIV